MVESKDIDHMERKGQLCTMGFKIKGTFLLGLLNQLKNKFWFPFIYSVKPGGRCASSTTKHFTKGCYTNILSRHAENEECVEGKTLITWTSTLPIPNTQRCWLRKKYWFLFPFHFFPYMYSCSYYFMSIQFHPAVLRKVIHQAPINFHYAKIG